MALSGRPSRRHSLRLSKAAWLLQESTNATRRLCRLNQLPYYRLGKLIHIPAEALRPLLNSAAARQELDRLLEGTITAPRAAKPSSPPPPISSALPTLKVIVR